MRRRLAAVTLAALALALAGCGGGQEARPLPETLAGELPATTAETETAPPEGSEGGSGTTLPGKEIFASAGCGSCHTLSDAGSSGTIGPNLDELQPSRDAVVEIVTNGRGAMPSFEDQLSEEEIQNVADYVSSVTGG